MSEEEVDPKNIVDAVVKVYVNGINQMLSQEQSLEAKIKGEKHVKSVADAWNILLERLAEE